MADVSHELGALRFVVDSPLSSKVAMFNKQTQQHQQNQLLNPFSGANGRVSPKPTFSKDEYGKPLAGSLTEMRGQKANMHVLREMLELCQIISSEGYNVKDEPSMRVIPFGELFNIYNYISDKVVGILLRARKHKLVEFEGEMLFQRRDDDVPIFLLKPILEIRRELEAKIEDIKRASSPAPQATTLMLDKGAHEQKLQEAGLAAPKRKSKSRTPSPASASAKAAVEPAAPAPTAAADKADAVAEQAVLQRPPVPPRPVTPPPKIAVTESAAAATEATQQPQSEAAAATAATATAAAEANAAETSLAAQPTESAKVETEVPTIEIQNAVNENAEHNNNSANSNNNTDTVLPTIEIQNAVEQVDNNSNNNTDIELPTIVIEATAVYTRGTEAPTESEQNSAATTVESTPTATAAAQADVNATALAETAPSAATENPQ